MANIAATDITVTILNKRRSDKVRNNIKLVFGDGTLTYPAGGVPISKKAFGCPNVIESLVVYDRTTGLGWTYDSTNEKLVASQGGSHSHSLLLKNAAVADGATTRVNAGTNLLGANTGSDISVAGGAANGGVQTATSTASEPSGVAIATQTLKIEVVGW